MYSLIKLLFSFVPWRVKAGRLTVLQRRAKGEEQNSGARRHLCRVLLEALQGTRAVYRLICQWLQVAEASDLCIPPLPPLPAVMSQRRWGPWLTHCTQLKLCSLTQQRIRISVVMSLLRPAPIVMPRPHSNYPHLHLLPLSWSNSCLDYCQGNNHPGCCGGQGPVSVEPDRQTEYKGNDPAQAGLVIWLFTPYAVLWRSVPRLLL